MKLKDFYFDLPKELIAQTPLENRADSKMLMLDKINGEIEHKNFYNIIDYINKDDCIVLNETKVIPGRLYGEKADTGGKVEILLLKRIDKDRWETLVKPGKNAKVNTRIIFQENVLEATVENIIEGGLRIIKFEYNGIFEEILDRLGEAPLPPYITEKLSDKNRYQTVYAKNEGSAAAPTAGLHFTNDLLDKLKKKGVAIGKVTLHVGLGTFRPVKVDNIEDHNMHSEYYEIDDENARIISEAKKNNGNIIAVGTTSVRTLESVYSKYGDIVPCRGDTDIFIYPGYKFNIVDKLITNFHLPESTLLMLVGAFATRENIMKAYNEAIEREYRFFSFGDAMFLH